MSEWLVVLGAVARKIKGSLGGFAPRLVAKWLLKPQHEQLQVRFRSVPTIYVNENYCHFLGDVVVRNQNLYDVSINAWECEIIISSYGIVNLDKAFPLTIKSQQEANIPLKHHLTDAQVRRIEGIYGTQGDMGGSFNFTFAVRTLHGDEIIRASEQAAVLLRKS